MDLLDGGSPLGFAMSAEDAQALALACRAAACHAGYSMDNLREEAERAGWNLLSLMQLLESMACAFELGALASGLLYEAVPATGRLAIPELRTGRLLDVGFKPPADASPPA